MCKRGGVDMARMKKTEQVAESKQISQSQAAGNRLPLLLEVKEAAAEMRTSPATVYRLINAGILPVLKLGRIKVPYKAIVEFVDRYIGHDVTDPNAIHKLKASETAELA